jgi:hypothetical protein
VGNVLGLNQSMQSLGRIVGPVAGQLAYGAGAGLPYLTAAALTGVGAVVAVVMLARMLARGFQPDTASES